MGSIIGLRVKALGLKLKVVWAHTPLMSVVHCEYADLGSGHMESRDIVPDFRRR